MTRALALLLAAVMTVLALGSIVVAEPAPAATTGAAATGNSGPRNTMRAAVAGVPEGALGSIAVQRIAGGDRVATAIALSRAVFDAADTVVLARADDPADALVGAPLAARRDAPILLTPRAALPAAVSEEIDRLGATAVVLLGGEAAIGPTVALDLALQGYDVDRVAGEDRFWTAAAIAERLGPTTRVAVANAFSPPDALAAAAWAAGSGRVILLTTRDAVPEATAEALTALDPHEVAVIGGTAVIDEATAATLGRGRTLRRLSGGSRYDTATAVRDVALLEGARADLLWLATGTSFPDALVAGPAVAAAGGTLLLVDGADLIAAPAPAQRIRAAAQAGELAQITLLGGASAINARAVPQLEIVIHGAQLPRGGRSLLPEHRLVAYYGNARVAAMGVLGEQPPDAAAERLAGVAAQYATPGHLVLPTFELIATVALRTPGLNGNYAAPSDPADIQRYLDAARRHGVYVVLDIQPGRSDFLTEVRRYERFLGEPDVGVALDPEWRMGPGGVPGQGVGSVDAAEVNQVVDYLAGIVARRNLPEKLLIVHQFQTRMITNRDQIRTPAGLAVLFHADGFGSKRQKLDTFHALASGPPYWNGFKLFYDEDPVLFTPQEVLALRPEVDFVSYQ